MAQAAGRQAVRPGVDEGRQGQAGRAGQADQHRARRSAAALARVQGVRRPPQDGCRRDPGRLGLCREPGLRHPAGRRQCPAPGRPGRRPRYVHPPPRDPARPEDRQLLPAAAAAGGFAGTGHHHRFAAQRRSRDGLRVRFLDHRSEHPVHLGRPVRRLRQRRPGGDRSVHRRRRSKVGPHLRPDPAAAAWL
ncbi:hypothetical protein D3C72_1232630 [compost metagenome]